MGPGVTWSELVAEAPDLSARVRARFEDHRHHVLATLTIIGSPRVSGTEVGWWRDQMWFGSMWGARKAKDLQGDPRFALHSNPGDGSMTGGDAKISGRAREIGEGALRAEFLAENEVPEPLHLFFLELASVTLTSLAEGAESLEISTWRPGEGVSTLRRA